MLPANLRRSVALPLAALVVAGLTALPAPEADATASAPVAARAVAPAAVSDPARPSGPVAGLARALPDFRLDRSRDVLVQARDYVASRISLPEVRDALAGAPTTTQRAGAAAPVRVSLVAPDGSTVLFDVVEDSVMEPGLQARHPELRTYAGTGVTDPSDTIRLSVTPAGLSASVRSVATNRTWYVDPAYGERGATAHVSYLRSALPPAERVAEREIETPPGAAPAERGEAELRRRAGESVVQRTYRMAWVTTPSYAADFATAPGGVLAEKVRVITAPTRSTSTTWPSSSCSSTARRRSTSTPWPRRPEPTGPAERAPASRRTRSPPAVVTGSTATTSWRARSSARTTSTSATSAPARAVAVSPTSASSAASSRPAGARRSTSHAVTSMRSTSSPTRSATRWVATTPSTASTAPACRPTGSRPPPSSPALAAP